MSDILNTLGLSAEDMSNAESSTIVKPFEPLASGIYTATLKDVHVYKNQWDGEQMRITVEVKDDSGDTRIITYRSDIGKTLKDGSANKGYAGRLKQVSHATSVPIENLTAGSEETIKVFGKDTKATPIVGFAGKTVKALIRNTNETTIEEGGKFKYSNDLQGLVAPDGTEEGGENGAEKFLELVAKTPIFTTTRKKKAGSTGGGEVKTASGASVNDML